MWDKSYVKREYWKLPTLVLSLPVRPIPAGHEKAPRDGGALRWRSAVEAGQLLGEKKPCPLMISVVRRIAVRSSPRKMGMCRPRF